MFALGYYGGLVLVADFVLGVLLGVCLCLPFGVYLLVRLWFAVCFTRVLF